MTLRTRLLLLPLALGAIAFGACSHSSSEQQGEPGSANPGMNPNQNQGMDAGSETMPNNTGTEGTNRNPSGSMTMDGGAGM